MKSIVPVLLLAPSGLLAQARPAVLVITDAEGVAGVCRQDQTERVPELERLLTGEVNAAVEGFFEGGAGEVVVWDGHAGSHTLSAETMHPRARLAMGRIDTARLVQRGFAGVAFVGQHARANRSGAVMAHSYSSQGIQEILLNGQPAGEIEIIAALAGDSGVPVIFLSGDRAATEDVHAVAPGAVTVAVKEGLGYYACISMPAAAARDAIRQGAARAVRGIAAMRPYRVPGPVTLQVEYTTRSTLAPDAPARVGALDARTTRYTGKDVAEAWDRWRGR